MCRTARLLILCVTLVNAARAQTTAEFKYPPAPRVNVTENYHGVDVADPYHWMEDMKSSETQKWVREEDQFLQSYLGEVREREHFRRRIRELTSDDLYQVPVKAGGRYFFMKTDAGGSPKGLYLQEGRSSKPLMLPDPAAKFRSIEAKLNSFSPSLDGRFVAYSISENQSSWLTIRVLDVAAGQDLPGIMLETNALYQGLVWTPDNKGFFYSSYERIGSSGDKATAGHPVVRYYSIADRREAIAYEPPKQDDLLLSYAVTADGSYLVLTSAHGSSSQNEILYKDLAKPRAQAIWLMKGADARYIFLGSEGPHFWLYTDYAAPRGRVIAVDITRPDRKNWSEVIPQAAEPIAANSSVGGNTLGMYGNRFVLMYLKDGRPRVRIFDRLGRLQYEPDLPNGGLIWGGFSGSQNDAEVLYQFLGLTDMSVIFRLDVEKQTNEVFYRPAVLFDRDSIVIEQVVYRSKDGTRVPMFVAHQKGLKLDGSHPTFMYGYGAFGWVSFMWYQPFVLNWLEMGGVYAQPGIRGGGEYGEAWHQAGSKHNKQNAIDDYIAAAEWLIKNRYTSPSRLVANGGSASGALAAAAIIQRPELFGAAVIDRPLLDLLRFDRFTQAAYWIPEFGSPGDPDDFKALRAWSPYQNVNPGHCYPATFVMSGDRDQTAVPLHAYKFTAAMQAAQSCQNPVLLKVMWGAGHNFGLTADQTSDSWGDQTAFLFRVLGLQTSQRAKR
jgi:prolyl oligopeptidase